MLSSLVPSIFFLVTTLLGSTKADNEFCGCQSQLPSAYITLPAPSGQSRFTSSDQCWAGCYAATNPTPAVAGRTNYRHSTWQQSTGTCTCTDRYPFGSAQRVGSQQTETCATPSDWYNTLVQTTFIKYPSCYTAAPQGFTMQSVTGPDTCSYRCAPFLQMVFYMNSVDGGYSCGCGRISTFPPTASQCGPNVYWIYYHTETQASQGLSRRAHREEAKRNFSKKTLCPKGFSACRVGDGSDAFECIDTERDIDSCGGCMHGSFDDPMSKRGEECQAPGVVMGYSTCDKGRCVASKCKPGHILVNEQCIKRAHLPGRRTGTDLQ